MTEHPDELRRDVAAWVRNAEEDRLIALAACEMGLHNGACFHCQQCVEKYLKAVLTACDHVPPRIHDLVALGTRAREYAPAIADLFEELKMLTGFAVVIRYPEREAHLDEAQDAIAAMERARPVLREALGLETPEEGPEAEDDDADDSDTGDDLAETP